MQATADHQAPAPGAYRTARALPRPRRRATVSESDCVAPMGSSAHASARRAGKAAPLPSGRARRATHRWKSGTRRTPTQRADRPLTKSARAQDCPHCAADRPRPAAIEVRRDAHRWRAPGSASLLRRCRDSSGAPLTTRAVARRSASDAAPPAHAPPLHLRGLRTAARDTNGLTTAAIPDVPARARRAR
jgi:hypothetical protein